jgi:hypothetical protein
MQILHSLAFVINDQSLQHVSMCILLLRFLASARICVPIRKCILRRSYLRSTAPAGEAMLLQSGLRPGPCSRFLKQDGVWNNSLSQSRTERSTAHDDLILRTPFALTCLFRHDVRQQSAQPVPRAAIFPRLGSMTLFSTTV